MKPRSSASGAILSDCEPQPFFRRLLERPQFDDEEKTLRARTFHRVVLETLAVTCAALALMILEQPASAGRRLQTVVILATTCIALLELNRRGRTRLASTLFVALLTALISWRAFNLGGISAPAATLYVTIAMTAGVLMGTRAAVAAAGVLVAIGFGLVMADRGGLLPVPTLRFSPVAVWLYNCLCLGLAIVLQHEITLRLRRSLDRAESELKARNQAEQRLRIAVEAGEIGVWDYDPRLQRLRGDERQFELYGIPVTGDRSIGYDTWIARVHHDDRAAAEATMRRLSEGAPNQHAEFRAVRPDGEVRHVEASGTVVLDAHGQTSLVVGVNRDVTARRRAEGDRAQLVHDLGERVKELRLLHSAARLLQRDRPADRALFEELVASLPAAWQYPECGEARIRYRDIVVSTPGWRETPWRLATTFTTSEGRGIIEVVYLEERPPSAEGPFVSEERALLDSLADMLVSYLELRKHHERLEELVATRTRELREAKDEAERASQAKGTFLATMSHEIRTPMNAILGYAQMLGRDRSLTPAQHEKVGIILSSGDHLLTLINNVLDLSRIEAGRATLVTAPLDLHALLADLSHMFESLASAKGIELVFQLAPELPRAVEGDAGKIRQVLINLLGNAIKFIEKGRITVQASAAARAGGGRHVTVVVADSGPGIGAADLERIFDAFEQSRLGAQVGGAGLGLAIGREFARLMGGALTATSRLGEGSTFTFTFEVTPVPMLPEPPQAGKVMPRLVAPPPEPRAATPASLGQLLEVLPRDLLRELRTAATEARPALLELLAARAAQHSEAAASEILTLSRRFRYQALTEALDACHGQG
jgi:signal transduction histidine kinase/PAS domain-containing protein